jgi:Cu(I)/Ag(I) efflux system membrane protein CusA/SilA
MMTVTTILVGLLPVLWSQGTGADVMKRIAAPMVGGVVTSAVLELLVYPALYAVWKVRKLEPGAADTPTPPAALRSPVERGKTGEHASPDEAADPHPGPYER